MDYFESIAKPNEVKKTLIYGGLESQERTKYSVLSWFNLKFIVVSVWFLCFHTVYMKLYTRKI